jgi:hypothetical protein
VTDERTQPRLGSRLQAIVDRCLEAPTSAQFRHEIERIAPSDWPRLYVRLRALLGARDRADVPLAEVKLTTLEEEWLRRAAG